MIVVCWQAWRGIRKESAVAKNKTCHDTGLKKQHLGYHKSWNCWYFTLLAWFWVLRCVDVGSACVFNIKCHSGFAVDQI